MACAAAPAVAHHSAAPFDMTKEVSLNGTVEKWLWSNPHSWLYIMVTKADGTQEVWGLEAGSTGMMSRTGWSASAMKPGDKITATLHPSRNGNHVGLLSTVKLANGKVLGGGFGAPPPGAAFAPPPRSVK